MKSVFFLAAGLWMGIVNAAPPQSTIQITVKIARGIAGNMGLNYLTGQQGEGFADEWLSLRTDKAINTFSRKLPDYTQIAFAGNIPVLVNAGDEMKITLSPVYKAGVIQPTKFHPEIAGKNAARQLLPYLIDSLYSNIDLAGLNTKQELDETIKKCAQQIAEQCTKLKLSSGNRALLKVFEQNRQMLARFSFITMHPTLEKDAALGAWLIDDFDIKTSALCGVGSIGFLMQTAGLWWGGRKIQDSLLTNQNRIEELLQLSNCEKLKGYEASGWIRREGEYYGFSTGFQSVYALCKKSLRPETVYAKAIDSMYKAESQLERGRPAHDFALENEQGETVRLSDFKGKKVIIDIWAMWCHGCVASLPTYVRLRERFKDDKNVVFITISWDGADKETKTKWKKFSRQHNIDGPNNLYLSSDRTDPQTKIFCEKYCLVGITRWIAIDENGNFIDGTVGSPESNKNFEQKVVDYLK